MNSRPSSKNPYLDFKTRIRKANTHAEAEEVLEYLRPSNIRRVCDKIVKDQGNGSRFEDDNFLVVRASETGVPQTVLCRKKESEFEIFHEKAGAIYTFRPIECWNVLNFLEEIADHGEIRI